MAAVSACTRTVAPSMRPGPGLHGAQHARRRLGQTGPRARRRRPRAGPHGGGVEGGAALPGRDAHGRHARSSAPAVSAKLETAPAHGLVQGARRPGRGVGHARGGAGPRRRRLVGRQPRARPGLRGLQARRPGDRRRAHGRVGGQGLRPPAVRRATRPARRGLPRGGDPRARAGGARRAAATCRPTTTPTSSPGSRRWPASSSSRCRTSARSSSPAAVAGCWRA